ncbi:MAG: cupredoxin domain-containing protein [Gemmatimonadota bacterium]
MTASRFAALFALAATVGLSACSGDSGTNGNGIGPAVQASNALAFTPAVLNVNTGEPMRFVFGSTAHTVIFAAADGKPEDIATPSSSKSVTRTFNTPGDFPYHCGIHPTMTGTVHVTAAPVTGTY